MACLAETEIAALVDGTLPSWFAADADAHLDRCEQCRGLVADLLMGRSGSPAVPRSSSCEPSSGARLVILPEGVDVGRRYRVLDLIGQGGMGRVFRAVDRVTGAHVALKRVQRGSSETSLAALAQEFRVLATLRHPNVVSVLDYGFDADRQPFVTMELLDGARPLLTAATEASRAAQVELLAQMLHALGYLHRHGILHRDLKPSNLLVTSAGGLKVVDFGLAMDAGEVPRVQAAGTLAYMAPELFLGAAASEASDLYAAGVVAYEVLAGQHPLRLTGTKAELIERILREVPDLSRLPPELRGPIGRALRKAPADRPEDAAAMLRELSRAAGLPACEPPPARDSYLVAARFTGREEELGRLCAALDEARRGRGSAWLVGGESGVGKSRLLEELRGRALAQGALVAAGQALASGGTALHPLRGALELLALHVALSDLEAGVLGAVVPNVGALLEREVSPPPEIEARAASLRLMDVLARVLRRAPEPALILLEDLQWADAETLSLLADVSTGIEELPLLVVASYRDDEARDLPVSLDAMSVMRLERFGQEEIAQLCASMLGPPGKAPELVSLVARETEGNAYFIVEVMRALAEESGGLDDVGRRGLPARILAGGVEQVLGRRLSRVPAAARSFLRLAAVAGRALDLRALARIEPAAEALAQACADAGVLEVHEQRYRYSHDKLRERVLGETAPAERRALHAAVARALREVYQGSAEHAARIAHHFREADEPAEAARHGAIAGFAALERGALREAAAAFEQVTLLHRRAPPPLLEEVRAWRGLAHARFGLGPLEAADEALRRVFALSGSPLPATEAGVAGAIAAQIAAQAAWRAGLGERLGLRPRDAAERALAEERLLALATQESYVWLDRPDMLMLCSLTGLNLEEALGAWDRTNFRASVAFVLSYTRLDGLCRRYLERGAALSPPGTRAANDYLRGLSLVRLNQGLWAEAAASAERAIAFAREREDDLCALLCLLQLQIAALGLDDYRRAAEVAAEIERLAARAESQRYLAFGHLARATAELRLGSLGEAESALGRARAILPKQMGPAPEAVHRGLSAACALMRGELRRAVELASEAVSLVERARAVVMELRLPLVCALEVYLSQPDARRTAPQVRSALSMMRRLASQFSSVEPSAALFQACWERHRGRPAAAASGLRRSLRLAEVTGSRHDRASARYALGCLSLLDARHVPEGAAGHLREALSLFEDMGSTFEAEKTRAALEGRCPPAAAAAGPRAGWR